MKTTSFFSTLVFVFSIQMLTAAPLVITPTIAPIEKKSLKDDDDKTTVTIIDDNQKKLIEEKIKSFSASDKQAFIDKYSKSLKMQDGRYTLVIKQKNSRITMPFTFEADKSKLVVAEKKGGHIPLINVKGNYLNVNYFMGKMANITFKILNEYGEQLYKDTHIDVCKLHQRYDISDLPYGTYTVQFTVGEDVLNYVVMK